MISPRALATVFLLCSVSNLGAQQPTAPQPYHDYDAYQIYALLLPHPVSNSSVKGTLAIRQETVKQLRGALGGFPMGPEACVYPSVAPEFAAAIADYNRLNQQRWLLQRDFQIELPYVIASSDTLNGLSKKHWWDDFYKHYPHSCGLQEMSAVGFNKERTRAILFMGEACGFVCGEWSFHLFKKVDGSWKQVPGVSCIDVS
jgi:hypothetical protein